MDEREYRLKFQKNCPFRRPPEFSVISSGPMGCGHPHDQFGRCGHMGMCPSIKERENKERKDYVPRMGT
jgi:hypothetical protein